ncbi:DedA family protein [Candidatus Woesearchaeota archaeon]|nr:DedA family protein [Candidatus Woesearchaeota archaeon]
MVFTQFLDVILHLDTYMSVLIQTFGIFVYVILFMVIFAETGLVLTPFLPGDSLLFVAGAFAGKGDLQVVVIFVLLLVAAILGDSVNYWVGSYFGEKMFVQRKLIKKEYLDKTKAFYDKHGGKTIILARFVPIVRTFAPFVAGVSRMQYSRFFSRNVIGGVLWVGLFVFGGYFFGTLPFVEKNLTTFILIIIAVSFIPIVVEIVRHKFQEKIVKNS